MAPRHYQWFLVQHQTFQGSLRRIDHLCVLHLYAVSLCDRPLKRFHGFPFNNNHGINFVSCYSSISFNLGGKRGKTVLIHWKWRTWFQVRCSSTSVRGQSSLYMVHFSTGFCNILGFNRWWSCRKHFTNITCVTTTFFFIYFLFQEAHLVFCMIVDAHLVCGARHRFCFSLTQFCIVLWRRWPQGLCMPTSDCIVRIV